MRFRYAGLLAACIGLWVGPLLKGGTSNSLMDISPDGTRLLVANPDSGTVTLIDANRHQAVREIRVGEKPEGTTWIGNGPLAAVTVYHEDLIAIVDTQKGQVIRRLAVADEPYGIVANRSGTLAWVTHEYPGKVSEVDLATFRVVRQFDAGPFVRGLALSSDEMILYVTEFYSAGLTAIDLKKGAVVDHWKGHSADNLCRHVMIHPRRPKAYLSHIRSKTDVAHGRGSIFPELSICDLGVPDGSRRRAEIALDTYNNVHVVTNPWESALTPNGKWLFTIYAGTDEMNLSEVIDDDYKEIARVGETIPVGHNPRAVRVSPDGSTVFIYNALDFGISAYLSESMKLVAEIPVCRPPKSPEWVRGKILFNSALPPLTSARWIACSSCHPDGHSDGRVWQNPEGLRKTTGLFGLAHTHPLHWSADRDEVQDFEYTIRGPLMQGSGLLHGPIKLKQGYQNIELEENLAGRSKDLDALAIYCNSFEFTLSPHIPAQGQLSAVAQRGKELFFSKNVGCAGCHSGPYYTDSCLKKPYQLHDVGTGTDDPSEKKGPRYDTPTLLGVYRTAPYLHHGKAKTLRDVLTTCNRQDKHGKTSHLAPADIDALVEFLQSLPFETPPRDTPNTVKFRFVPKDG